MVTKESGCAANFSRVDNLDLSYRFFLKDGQVDEIGVYIKRIILSLRTIHTPRR